VINEESSITDPKLREAFDQLRNTIAGEPIAEAIRDRGTRIRFGKARRNSFSQFDALFNEITINNRCRDASPAALAAHLAHEGTHLLWDEPNSIEQEYDAFSAEAAVWSELRGDDRDKQCDLVLAMINQGEREARRQIRRLYPELPEHGFFREE